jgi:hypothetical protein
MKFKEAQLTAEDTDVVFSGSRVLCRRKGSPSAGARRSGEDRVVEVSSAPYGSSLGTTKGYT